MELNQFGGSRTDTLIKFILVFFISLLSFSVGTFVGKQFSDSQHRIAQLNTDYEKSESSLRETASIPDGQLNVEPDKALTDEDVAKLAEDFVAEGSDKVEEIKVEDAHGGKRDVASKEAAKVPEKIEMEHSNAVLTKKETTHGTTVEKAADKVSKGEAPLAPQKPEIKTRKPELPNTVAATTVGKYTVQIAAQPSEELAKEQSLKLKDEGYSAFYVEGAKDGKKWYRVNIGMFSNKQDASDYAKKLAEKIAFKGAFVKEIIQ